MFNRRPFIGTIGRIAIHALLAGASVPAAIADAIATMKKLPMPSLPTSYRSRGKGRGTPSRRFGNRSGIRYGEHSRPEDCRGIEREIVEAAVARRARRALRPQAMAS